MKQLKYIWHACLWSSLVALPYIIGMMTSILLAGVIVTALADTCAAADMQSQTSTAAVSTRLTFTEREQQIWDALIETRRQLQQSKADLAQERTEHAMAREALAAAEAVPATPPSVAGPEGPPPFQWSTFAAGAGAGMALAAGLVLGILLSVN